MLWFIIVIHFILFPDQPKSVLSLQRITGKRGLSCTSSVDHQSCFQSVEMILGTEQLALRPQYSHQINSWFPESGVSGYQECVAFRGRTGESPRCHRSHPVVVRKLKSIDRSHNNKTHFTHHTLTLASFCPAQWSKEKMDLKQWQARCCQVGVLEMLRCSSTGCHPDIEPSSGLSTD